MTRIDENKEAVAQIRMAIDRDKEARRKAAEEEDKDTTNIPITQPQPDASLAWSFGSPSSGLVTSREIERNRKGDPAFRDFDMRLRLFLLRAFPDEVLHVHHVLKVRLIPSRDDHCH